MCRCGDRRGAKKGIGLTLGGILIKLLRSLVK
jgi:hypothetical protein